MQIPDRLKRVIFSDGWYTSLTVLSLSFVLLAGCSNHAPAPVYDLYANPKSSSNNRSQQSTERQTGSPVNSKTGAEHYRVKPGDTLYSIAWQFGIDYKLLAKRNQLKRYRIYPGQVLRLRPARSDSEKLFDPQRLRIAIETEVLGHTASINKPRRAGRSASTSKQRGNRHRYGSRSGAKASVNAVTTNRAKSSSAKGHTIQRWIWPVQGPILAKFSARKNDNKGLDIGGKKGMAVRAAAPGRVVYSGNGLRGYGNLVIIKHNDEFLSAYAHNSAIHVEENEIVKAGQRIAEVGSTGAKEDKLHFEIRFRGRPVDPLNYLPGLN